LSQSTYGCVITGVAGPRVIHLISGCNRQRLKTQHRITGKNTRKNIATGWRRPRIACLQLRHYWHVVQEKPINAGYHLYWPEMEMGQWVMGQIGYYFWMGHMGHGSLPATHWSMMK